MSRYVVGGGGEGFREPEAEACAFPLRSLTGACPFVSFLTCAPDGLIPLDCGEGEASSSFFTLGLDADVFAVLGTAGTLLPDRFIAAPSVGYAVYE